MVKTSLRLNIQEAMSFGEIGRDPYFWVLEGLCSLHRKPYSSALAVQHVAAPFTAESLKVSLSEYGFDVSTKKIRARKLKEEAFPLLVWMRLAQSLTDTGKESAPAAQTLTITPALIMQADENNLLVVESTDAAPVTLSYEQFEQRYTGQVMRVTPLADACSDIDSDTAQREARRFGFRWFVPELLKHRQIWKEILLASLVIQLIALGTPLFTQAIIDKVVVHRTESTLIVLAIGMMVFILFSGGLSWLRQYLVLHTGNRVDAVLGASVFERLFKLPPMYFNHRPTGVIAARMQGVETIREFISGAAVTLILDCPFLLIFVAIMLYYSVKLTLIVAAFLVLIVGLSAMVAPLFQTRLQEQFQLGARNQAFLTEYLVGMETVKSLQLEPQLNSRYRGFLASALQAGFSTKQLANSYNAVSNVLEQLMSLVILAVGAYTVMHSKEFTIGMLVAFQMFSGRLSQPMLRLVGLWQQFQQAKLSVARLGDLMNAPVEHYSVIPARQTARRGEIAIHEIGFRYAEHLPMVYQNLSMQINPGQTIGIMGPSGCGKSTLAKLMQGFYQPNAGRITIDGVDIRYLSANELRSYFGVVPQETVLFSGTIYENLQLASPDAKFDQIVAACKMAEIHSVIEAMPKGYQTEIGERGAGLSGGQRQRIAIARALLKRPSILVFDEATSALDAQTAEQFAQTINALKGKITMLFITHGLPKGLKVDAVFRLTEHGAQLLAPAPPASANAMPSQASATPNGAHGGLRTVSQTGDIND